MPARSHRASLAAALLPMVFAVATAPMAQERRPWADPPAASTTAPSAPPTRPTPAPASPSGSYREPDQTATTAPAARPDAPPAVAAPARPTVETPPAPRQQEAAPARPIPEAAPSRPQQEAAPVRPLPEPPRPRRDASPLDPGTRSARPEPPPILDPSPPVRSVQPRPALPPEPPPSVADRPSGSDLAERASAAQELTVAYFDYWSSPNAQTLAATPEFYGPRVIFHGRSVTARELLEEKRRFVQRWPERRYRPRADTMGVACEPGGRSCTVRSVFDFAASNPARGRKSQGIATVELVVSFQGDRPVITAESSLVHGRGASRVSLEDDSDE